MKRRLLALIGSFVLCIAGPSPHAFSEEPSVDIVFAEKCDAENQLECKILESKNADTVSFSRNLAQGEKFSLHLFIKNTEAQNVVTVRSWLEYDTTLLKAVNLLDQNSDFSLAAPDGNEIDTEAGQVKIGRGVAGGGASADTLLIATVEFEVISSQSQSTEISFVNFQPDDLGDVGVFTLNQTTFQPENILQQEPKSLEIRLNVGSTPTPSDTSQKEGTGKIQDDISNAVDTALDTVRDVVTSDRLARPEGLRIQAKPASTNLIWQLSDDPQVRGYFMYYSENSGFYIHRKDVGKTNRIEFNDLTKNKKYYFAVTAYDAEGKESDYSDEVYATAGVLGSESHPFTLKANGNISKTPPSTIKKSPTPQTLDESGPAENIALALGILGVFFLLFSCFRLRLFSFFV